MSFTHPNVGTISANGEGIGSITVSMANDRTVHDIAADGSVMASKIKAANGTITISVQQTSNLNKFLLRWYNYIDAADTSQWIAASMNIRAPKMGDSIVIKGVSPQKLPDKPYQAQGGQISWVLMATYITQQNI
jgi:hypothetical protein